MKDERLGLPSASRMDRIARCPGSLNAERECKEEESNEVAESGTRIHEALESQSFDEMEDEDEKTIATRLESMRDEATQHWLDEIGADECEVEREKRLWVTHGGAKVASAQLDYYAIAGDNALILDYKSGYKEIVRAFTNYQVRTQALALWHNNRKLKTIRAGIAAYRFREQFSVVDFNLSLLLRSDRELQFLLWRANQHEAERVPGPWCDNCRAKLNCAAAGAYAMLPAATVPSLGIQPSDEDILKAVCHLNVEQLAMLHARKGTVEKILSAVNNRLRNLSVEELASVGLKLRPGNEISKVKDIMDVFKAFTEAGLITTEQFQNCCTVVLSRLKEVVSDNLIQQGVKTKKDAELRIKKMLGPLVEKVRTAPIIAKLSKEDLKNMKEAND